MYVIDLENFEQYETPFHLTPILRLMISITIRGAKYLQIFLHFESGRVTATRASKSADLFSSKICRTWINSGPSIQMPKQEGQMSSVVSDGP